MAAETISGENAGAAQKSSARRFTAGRAPGSKRSSRSAPDATSQKSEAWPLDVALSIMTDTINNVEDSGAADGGISTKVVNVPAGYIPGKPHTAVVYLFGVWACELCGTLSRTVGVCANEACAAHGRTTAQGGAE